MALNHYYYLSLLLALVSTSPLSATPKVTFVANKSNAVYGIGEEVEWKVKITDDQSSVPTEASFSVKKGNSLVLEQGKLVLTNGEAVIKTSLNEPGTLLAEVILPTPEPKDAKALPHLAGAVVAPEKITPSQPCPADFDLFWKTKLADLAAVPENAILEKGDSGVPNVDYWKITMDNIGGTKIQGQLARPSGDQKLPALLIVQWAGVYPLDKKWATDRAAEGWLVLNLMAHDLSIDEKPEFYKNLTETTLKNYQVSGKEDREKSYFVRMFLSCSRGVDYLASRPDWDGKTLVAAGTSQGGLQSFVAAGLNPKVTAMMAMVPAGCDTTGELVGRKNGWPAWEKETPAALKTFPYFDALNFASRVRCPALVGVGLLDTTASPSGIFATFNQLTGPKEMVILADSDHKGSNGTQVPYINRAAVWRSALLQGDPVPPIPKTP